MTSLWFVGFLLLVAGTLVMILNRVKTEAAIINAIKNRGIHPHIWGYHVMVGGAVLTLILHSVKLTPWVETSVPVRGLIAVQAIWGFFAVATAGFALLGSSIRGRPGFGFFAGNVLPGPDAVFASWSPWYRAFLILGLANTTLMVLLVW